MKPYYEKAGITIYHGDCLDLKSMLPMADLIVTDPPYPKEFADCWESLGQVAESVLKDGRYLVTLLGHYQLDYVVHTLSKHLRYYWCGTLPNNNQPIMHGFQMKVCWKPILMYSKGQPCKHEMMVDDFNIGSRSWNASWKSAKSGHDWGQSEASCFEPIAKLASVGEYVLDPFVGSGTTLIAARRLGRKAIGIERERKSIAN